MTHIATVRSKQSSFGLLQVTMLFRAVSCGLILPFLLGITYSSSEAACAQPPISIPGTWCFEDGQHVRVWWKNINGDPGLQEQAKQVRDEVENHLWKKFENLLGRTPPSDGDTNIYRFNGGDGRYDIMLGAPTRERAGLTEPVPSRSANHPGPAKFSIINAVTDKSVFAAVAHELMHGFLAAFDCRRECMWFSEATATWAEHFAYPDKNTEFAYTKWFFPFPNIPLDLKVEDQDLHMSGAYLFLLFLQYQLGGELLSNNPTWVREIWEITETADNATAAVDEGLKKAGWGGFTGVWSLFIASNWNKHPAGPRLVRTPTQKGFYEHWDNVKDGVSARIQAFEDKEVSISGQGFSENPMKFELEHLSAKYYRFEFKNPNVRSVRIIHNLKEQRSKGNQSAHVVIFTKIKDDWRIEADLDAGNSIQFCRDKAAERIEELIVIFGNSDQHKSSKINFKGPQDKDPQLTATNIGCSKWKGRTKSESKYNSADSSMRMTLTTAAEFVFELIPMPGGPGTEGIPPIWHAKIDGVGKGTFVVESRACNKSGEFTVSGDPRSLADRSRPSKTGLFWGQTFDPYQTSGPLSRVFNWQLVADLGMKAGSPCPIIAFVLNSVGHFGDQSLKVSPNGVIDTTYRRNDSGFDEFYELRFEPLSEPDELPVM